ncbi:MAG: helix-turn-helix domain-containing protein [Acutalibacteraceae bacterium]|nr:helix-turn-helix domain-containing protein [Acutalibacteraceae bacterium]
MEIKMSKSLQRVFDFMLEEGGITSLDSFVELGETRLSARIFELKKKGVNISSKNISVKNRYGEKRNVKKYFIG